MEQKRPLSSISCLKHRDALLHGCESAPHVCIECLHLKSCAMPVESGQVSSFGMFSNQAIARLLTMRVFQVNGPNNFTKRRTPSPDFTSESDQPVHPRLQDPNIQCHVVGGCHGSPKKKWLKEDSISSTPQSNSANRLALWQ